MDRISTYRYRVGDREYQILGTIVPFEDLTRAERDMIVANNRQYWSTTRRYKWFCCRSGSEMHVGERARNCKYVHNIRPILNTTVQSTESSKNLVDKAYALYQQMSPEMRQVFLNQITSEPF